MKRTVYLYRSPECIRGWLAYLKLPGYSGCTVVVEIEAKDGPDAKNRAVTAANNGWKGVTIVKIQRNTGSIWDADKFPDLKFPDILPREDAETMLSTPEIEEKDGWKQISNRPWHDLHAMTQKMVHMILEKPEAERTDKENQLLSEMRSWYSEEPYDLTLFEAATRHAADILADYIRKNPEVRILFKDLDTNNNRAMSMMNRIILKFAGRGGYVQINVRKWVYKNRTKNWVEPTLTYETSPDFNHGRLYNVVVVFGQAGDPETSDYRFMLIPEPGARLIFVP